ncbi:sensor histidine kinase [Aquipuribacter nitratireducens]|uniref:Sensor-like histidine kinase SenX3 n=1 Tax=Aquipuribacter nitratireducens TaxID=650104 RepID=A0ABW0GNM4_9MICO
MAAADVVLVVVAVSAGAVLALVAAFALGVRWASPSSGRRTRPGAVDVMARALEETDRPLLVVTRGARVVHASREAVGLGLVRAGFLTHDEVRDIVRAALEAPGDRPGGVEHRLALSRGPLGPGTVEVRLVVRRLDADHVLLDVENRSEAMRVEDVRRDFVVNVSHELKTPVGAISVLAETLESAADDADAVRRFSGRLRQESHRLERLVADVVELSRVQVVDRPGARDVVRLDDVVDDALDQVRVTADEAGIALARSRPSDVRVVGDRELLTTAVRNLLSNAVAYSPGGTRVSVAVGRRDGLALVQVTDRGIGIPVQEQERVFERFYRVDPARSRRTGGTGLGLAIVKHVAEDHGGDVTLWSRPGQGSTFGLRLPDADSPAPRGHDSPDAGPPRSGTPGGHE